MYRVLILVFLMFISACAHKSAIKNGGQVESSGGDTTSKDSSNVSGMLMEGDEVPTGDSGDIENNMATSGDSGSESIINGDEEQVGLPEVKDSVKKDKKVDKATKVEEKNIVLFRNQILKQIFDSRNFKLNTVTDFYGVDCLLLDINFYIDDQGKMILSNNQKKITDEDTSSSTAPEEEQNKSSEAEFGQLVGEKVKNIKEAEYYLRGSKIQPARKVYPKFYLFPEHIVSFQELLSKYPDSDEKLILFVFLNGSHIKTYTEKKRNFERTIYAKFVSDYFYKARKNIRIEYRYIENMPEEEMFLVLLEYDGIISANIYNTERVSILQWLDQVTDLEKKRMQDSVKKRKNLENLINASSKDETSVIEIGSEKRVSEGGVESDTKPSEEVLDEGRVEFNTPDKKAPHTNKKESPFVKKSKKAAPKRSAPTRSFRPRS